MKKTVSLLLMVTLIAGLLLTGCSSKDNGDAGSDTGNDGANTSNAAKKIVVFQSKVEIVDQLEALAKEYKEATGVEVEVIGTTGDDYLQQLKIKLSNNQGPTVFSLAPGAESKELASYLEDISDLSFVGDIIEGKADVADGKTIGIPYTLEGFGVVYNKNLIDASKVTTTDEFIQMLKDQKDAGINGFSLSSESYFLIGHILNTPFALQADPADYINKLVAGEVTMQDTPEFQEFGKLMEAVREYTANPLEVNYDKECGDFATGKTASIHQGNWSYSMFKDYTIDFDMGIMPLPISGNDKLAVSVPSCWYVNSQASDAEKQAGKDFLNWLYTSDTGKKYLMEEFGFIPVLKSMTSEHLDPLSQSVSDYTTEGKIIGWPNALWPAGIVDVYLVPIMQDFFTSDMNAQTLLEKLSAAFVEAGK